MRKNKELNNQLISIIMPVYNAGDFLVEAIESILNQAYCNWELIAINDGSTDNSLEILKKFAKKDKRIRVFSFKKRKGLASALNKSLDLARGFYIARMDADDISLPKRLTTQLNYLKKNPEIVAIGSQVRLIDENGNIIGYKKFPIEADRLYRMMMTMVAIQHPTLVTYAHLIKKCRYANHKTAEDVSMFFKLLHFGKFANTRETLFLYRIRESSNSLKDPKKTFFLTFKSRINAILNLGYKPTLKDVFINIIQLIIVVILPANTILYLYKRLRFNPVPARSSFLKRRFTLLLK